MSQPDPLTLYRRQVVADLLRQNRYRIARFFGHELPAVNADPWNPEMAFYANMAREIIDALDPIDTAAALARITSDTP